MARTINEIRAAIEADFINNLVLGELYGLDPEKAFRDQFSEVSLETILIYIVSVAIWSMEKIIDSAREEISARIETNALCSIPWYHALCLNFQLGHALEFNEGTYRFAYREEVPSTRIIKFAAVRQLEVEGVTKLRLYVSKAGKEPLTASEKLAFTRYIHEAGAAGTHFEIVSETPSPLGFSLQVSYNPMVLDTEGVRLDGGGKPVEEAITGYLDTIKYGGVFNRTKLVDAIQRAEGVTDVILTEVRIGAEAGEPVTTQNVEAPGGAFTFNETSSVISYSVGYDY